MSQETKHSAFRTWLTTFLLEKEMYKSTESQLLTKDAKDAGNHYGLTVEFQLEFLDNNKQYQKQIKDTFVKIDFHNADCLGYWKKLTSGMFAQMRSTAMFPEMYAEPYPHLFGSINS